MHFYARLKRNSSIYQEWKAQSRLAGFVDGVLFKLKGFDFVTDKLDTEHIDKIRVRQDQAIELEAIYIEPIILADSNEPMHQSLEHVIATTEIYEKELVKPRRPRLRK